MVERFGFEVHEVTALVLVNLVATMIFALALALKTCFPKSDPGDIAPTAAVAFTITHIAAVFLLALLGYLWRAAPAAVFALAAGIVGISAALALMIPRDPGRGNETILTRALPAPAE